MSENELGYGPIKVFNSLVEIDGEKVFGGDVSERRFDFFKRLAKMFGVRVRVHYESSRDTRVLYHTISKVGVSRLIDNRVRSFKNISKAEVEKDGLDGLKKLFS